LFDRQDKLFDQIEKHFEMKKRFENVKKIEASYAEQKENAIKDRVLLFTFYIQYNSYYF